VNVDEAGFSIHTDAKTGEVTVTLRQLFNEAEVKALLAKAGVPTAFHNSTLPASAPARLRCCARGRGRAHRSGSVISKPHFEAARRGHHDLPVEDARRLRPRHLIYVTIGTGDAVGHSGREPTLLSGEPTGCVLS
jgi:hypothetical protein